MQLENDTWAAHMEAKLFEHRIINVATRADMVATDMALIGAMLDERLDARFAPANVRLNAFDARLDAFDARLDAFDARLDASHRAALITLVQSRRTAAENANTRAYESYYHFAGMGAHHQPAHDLVLQQTALTPLIPPFGRLAAFQANRDVFRARAPPLLEGEEDDWTAWPFDGVVDGMPLMAGEPLFVVPRRALLAFPRHVADIEVGLSNRTLLLMSALYGVDFVQPNVPPAALDAVNRDALCFTPLSRTLRSVALSAVSESVVVVLENKSSCPVHLFLKRASPPGARAIAASFPAS
ncbi:hypothetical protein AMAG_09114 [Allomyces macrogynus ATCC 38327]|uniref:Uncharacterized protein n=1 Tax=Allomyces macrogynus (strain ATCC 38327) TaxID=578462 RepID=A0A0L0SNG3_ALLM3|nr:hypothetical protein AMAG_09114 [Allomyces macrogynus ATCC 38327]|eukprot:KNE64056.1 hypothetical protein AMAG_09114 [Allomyces macrogynus ATCC 38327]